MDRAAQSGDHPRRAQGEIQVLAQQGKGIREIARLLGCSRKTVRRVLRQECKERYGPRPSRPKKVDPYVEYLRERIDRAKPERLAATVLLRESGYSQLADLVASLRPPAEPEPVVRFETEPGKQCQIDFLVFRKRPTKLVAFTAKLRYSRYGYAEFADNERIEMLIACLENAFIFFGGVPLTLLCDNPKTIVLNRDAYGEGKHRLNVPFLDFVRHYGVRVKLCHPYRAQTKGKVERFQRYLRQSFYVPLMTRIKPALVDVATANREVRPWLNEVAHPRNDQRAAVEAVICRPEIDPRSRSPTLRGSSRR